MNNKQAFKILKNTPIRSKDNHIEYSKALHISLAALEKQIPKKVLVNGEKNIDLLCPNCKEYVGYIDCLSMSCLSFCSNCGQALECDTLSFLIE